MAGNFEYFERLLSASYNDAKQVTFSCTADADPVDNTGLVQVHAGNTVQCSVDLPSACTTMSIAASGMVVLGTRDGAVVMIPPGGDTTQQLYRHPSRERVDAVEISGDDDSAIATIGLNVIIISRVLLTTVLHVASIKCIEIPEVEDRSKPAGAFRSIHFCEDDGMVLLCETGSRGGIVVLRDGKYYCHLMGCHENVDSRFSSRAFRFVGCGLVKRTKDDGAFVVMGIENWGDLALWVVDKRGREGCALEVTKTWDIPMRSALSVSLSMYHHADDPGVLSFAVAYSAPSMPHSRRARQRDPGWVSVFTVPIQNLLVDDEELDQRIAEAEIEDDYAQMKKLAKEKRKLRTLEQNDLDAFEDRPDGCRHIESLQFQETGCLLVASKGTTERGWPVAGSACVRKFEQIREMGANHQQFLPYLAVSHTYPEWRRPAKDKASVAVAQDTDDDDKPKSEDRVLDEEGDY